MFARTIAREVAQVEPRGGYLRHIVEAGGVEFSQQKRRSSRSRWRETSLYDGKEDQYRREYKIERN